MHLWCQIISKVYCLIISISILVNYTILFTFYPVTIIGMELMTYLHDSVSLQLLNFSKKLNSVVENFYFLTIRIKDNDL